MVKKKKLPKAIDDAYDYIVEAISDKLSKDKDLPTKIMEEAFEEWLIGNLNNAYDKKGGQHMFVAPELWKHLLNAGIPEESLIYAISELMGYMVTKKKVNVHLNAQWTQEGGLDDEGCIINKYFVNDGGVTNITGRITAPPSLGLKEPVVAEIWFRIEDW